MDDQDKLGAYMMERAGEIIVASGLFHEALHAMADGWEDGAPVGDEMDAMSRSLSLSATFADLYQAVQDVQAILTAMAVLMLDDEANA